MSRLEELIQELCPDGVEYKELETVCGFMSGFAFKASTFTDSGEPICKTTNIQNNEISFQSMDCFNLSDYSENLDKYLIRPNDIVIGMSGTIKIGINRTSDCCYLNQRVGKFTPNETFLNNKFLYYILCNSVASLADGITGGSVKNLSNKDILKLSIPVPPIEVQSEIVRILDYFTLLTAELTTELTARKQQYEYYAEKLLSFDDTYDYLPLSDVADFRNGKGHEKAIVASGKYIVVNSKFISTNGEVKKYANEQISPLYSSDILMVMSDLPNGRALAKTFLVDEDDTYTLNQRICALHVKDEKQYMTKFLYFFLNRNPQLLKYDNGVDQTNLKKDDILTVQVPVIPVESQKSVISFLEKLETLCLDIVDGLPAEIEARQKQYEYYRDKLLTFKRLA